MKNTVRITMVAALSGVTSFAHAATTASGDGSQLAIYIFLGMCAMIIVVQLLPVIFLAFAFMKALVQGKKEAVSAPTEVVIEK